MGAPVKLDYEILNGQRLLALTPDREHHNAIFAGDSALLTPSDARALARQLNIWAELEGEPI
jgi:hypothetical protein